MKRLNVLTLPEKIMLALLMVVSIAYAALSCAGHVQNAAFSKAIRDISAQAHLQYDNQRSTKPYTYQSLVYCHHSDADPNYVCVMSNKKQIDARMISTLYPTD